MPASWPFHLPSRPGGATEVICFGHALVDRLARTTAETVVAAGIEPSAMTIVDSSRAAVIEGSYDGWEEVAGGSAANTAAGIASLGGSSAFVGAVGADAAGRRYAADLEAAGVRCVIDEVAGDGPTGVCHVFVTPDGERSMATCLGAAGRLGERAVGRAGIGASLAIYLEGYLFDAPEATEAVGRALALAREEETLVSLTLSDAFVVDRHRDRLHDLLASGAVDLLFGNEEEVLSLTGAASIEQVAGTMPYKDLACIVTRGAAGSTAITPGGTAHAAAAPVERVLDSTGAGDLFAAGVLYGLSRGRGPRSCLLLGSVAAAEVISHIGARPWRRLAELATGA